MCRDHSRPMPPAEVVRYRESWPEEFELVAAEVTHALADIDHTVEHVGSTAVPGLAAKPILDVLAVLGCGADASAAIRALGQHGWQHEGDGGRPGRESFTVRRDLPYQHLYLVRRGTDQHLHPAWFRDILRSDEQAREQYAELKGRLAPLLAADRVAYTEGKTDLIKSILRRYRYLSEDAQ